MKIHTLSALKDNFIYILENDGACAVIDPGEAEPVQRFLRRSNLKLTHILCTHHHPDHTAGAAALREESGAALWISALDDGRIARPERELRDGERAPLLGEEFEVLQLPGHTRGQIVYYWPKLKAVFTGDTLFSCGCGRLFEGTFAEMFGSMKRLRALPSETKVFFGHEYTLRNIEFLEAKGGDSADLRAYRAACEKRLADGQPTTPTTIAQEMRINPFLNAPDVATFTHWRELRNAW